MDEREIMEDFFNSMNWESIAQHKGVLTQLEILNREGNPQTADACCSLIEIIDQIHNTGDILGHTVFDE